MSVISDLLNKGELPKVQVEVKLSKETMFDISACAIIAALVIVILNKVLFK